MLGRARLEKGRALVAEGALAALSVKPGVVDAEVRDRGRSLLAVRLRVRPLNERVFDGALKAFAERARTAAELLSGSLPEEADSVFAAAGGALLPVSANEVSVTCPCADGPGCRHAAAVHVALAERFDRDPFLLLLLRGKGRDEILSRLREARARRTLPAARRRADARRGRRGPSRSSRSPTCGPSRSSGRSSPSRRSRPASSRPSTPRRS